MKKITAMFTALIVAFSLTAFAAEKAADVTPNDASPALEKKVEGKKTSAKKKTQRRNYFKGEVKAVDAKAGTVTVTKGEKTFVVDEKILATVNVGDKVSVKFDEKDGQATAASIKPMKVRNKKKDAM